MNKKQIRELFEKYEDCVRALMSEGINDFYALNFIGNYYGVTPERIKEFLEKLRFIEDKGD